MSDINNLNHLEDGLEDKASSKHLDAPITQDAVFGEITEEGPNYRNVLILLP